MTWEDLILSPEFNKWILERTSSAQIPQGSRLDPFITSMRVSGQAVPWLAEIRKTGSLTVPNDITQATADMRGAGLLQSENSQIVLTQLGSKIADEYAAFAILDSDEENELPRCMLLAIYGILYKDARYIGYLEFWNELRSSFNVNKLLDSPQGLYLVSYLDYQIKGFTPWEIALNESAGSLEPNGLDFERLKARFSKEEGEALDSFQRRVTDYANRPAGRVNFCTAMEALMISEVEVAGFLRARGVSPETIAICVSIYKKAYSELELPKKIDDLFGQRVQRAQADVDSRGIDSGELPADYFPNLVPSRIEITVSRFIRDTKLTKYLKNLHKNQCQLCAQPFHFENGQAYTEAHHIRPLGNPHNGPDIKENIIIVCPNHHAMCDFGGIKLDSKQVRQHEKHPIDEKNISYHNTTIYRTK